MIRLILSRQTNYLRGSQVILQRFLSTKSAAVPVGTGLSTAQASDNLPVLYVPSLFSRIKMKMGLQGDLREPQAILYQAAAISYYMIGSSVDFDAIQRELDMPDVFASYGRIVFLHMWFLLARYVQLGKSDESDLRISVLFSRSHRCISSSSISTYYVGRSRPPCPTDYSRSNKTSP